MYFQKDAASTSNFYETQRQVYQGSTSGTLLRQWMTCYNGNGTPSTCATTAVSSPITQRTITDQYGSSGLQCQHTYKYNSVGGLIEQDDYDYGSSGPGGLLRQTLITYASLQNITAFKQTVTVKNGSGTVISQTNYNYDETSLAPTSGITQHTSVSGSRGNLTSINYPVSGLTSHFTYYDTGVPNTSQDVNGATTTYNYSSANNAYCNWAFPTSVSEPLSMSRSFAWNCTGGVMTSLTDENGNTTSMTYNDPYFWRPASVTDPTTAVTNTSYNGLTSVESTLSINSNSVVDSLTALDGLGRTRLSQMRQAPGSSNFDTQEQDYDSLGRPSRSTLPYTGTSGQTNSTAPAVSTTYDALDRPLTVTDAGGGTVTYSYSQNDILVTVGPAPSGEHTKSRQLEYDGLGRLTSVCEITGAGGSCGQNTAATGYPTNYTYDALGNLLTVTQTAQTRNFAYDAMSRLTSETNPESGTTTYVYDTDTTCGTFSGDRVKKTDAVGNVTCTAYDALHRATSVNTPSGSYASVTPTKKFVYDSATINGATMSNVKGRLAQAYTCTGWCTSQITNEGFSYTARGEVSDVYQYSIHSGGYYHLTQTYWPHGAVDQLSGLSGLPTIIYGGTIGSAVGLDGEGRITQVTAGTGQDPVTGVSYNTGSLPTQVNFGSGDNDIFAYDPNTLRMTQFKFNVGTQSQYLNGGLTWNANSSLSQLAITDQFNSANTQTCNYSHDDLTRIAAANCGTAAAQTFSYDRYGNISKSGSPYSFSANYSVSTNQINCIGFWGFGCSGFVPTYDANGNVTNDDNHTYSWDAYSNAITIDTDSLTFDALDRMVEQNRSGSYTEIVYTPTGAKLALMNGSSFTNAFVPLPGQATAVYTSSGLDHYRHSDWLGSARLTSSPSQTYISSVAYAPYGETYAQSGTADPSFTGMNPDTVSTDYDFMFREYSTEGRWPSPDPAGLAAADPSNPQSWNRYSYVLNDPLAYVDPTGLCPNDNSWGAYLCQLAQSMGSTTFFGGTGGTWDEFSLLQAILTQTQISDVSATLAGVPTGDTQTIYTDLSLLDLLGGNTSGFTLGIRAPGQSFNQCLVANAKNYSAGGVFALSTNTNIGAGTVGQALAGNVFTSGYAALAGSVEDAVTLAGTSSPDLLNSAIGTTTTFGRRTSNILALNLAGKGGLPQALSSSSGGLKSFLGSASKAFNLGLDASLKAAGDLGLFGAEIIGCSIHR